MKHKILLLRSSIGVFGAERVVLELAKELLQTEFEPIVGIIENKHQACRELAVAAEQDGIKSQIFQCSRPFDLGTVRQIRRYLKSRSVNIVHAHGYKANFYAILSSMFRNVACVATCHPWTETEYSYKARMYTALDKGLLRRMDSIVAISAEVRDELHNSIKRTDVEVIPNGIDTRKFSGIASPSLRSELNMSEDDLIVGTIGRFVQEKGYKYLIESLKVLSYEKKTIKVVFVGEGPLCEELEQRVLAAGLQDLVSFLGVRNDIPKLLAIIDVFVLSSISEGLPMVILEAMAAGKAIVATTVGNIPSVLKNNVTALLVPPRDSVALAKAIQTCLFEPVLRDRLGRAARKQVQSKYSAQHMTRQYLTVYDRLLHS